MKDGITFMPPQKDQQGSETVIEDFPVSSQDLVKLMGDVLSKGGTFRFRAKGLSMTPFIKDGDEITIASPSKVEPTVGKVVAYVQSISGNLIVHRIVGKQGRTFLIQGDNVAGQPDEFILPQDILGCVTRVERDGRRVNLGLGLERYPIAILSRRGLLGILLMQVRAMIVRRKQ